MELGWQWGVVQQEYSTKTRVASSQHVRPSSEFVASHVKVENHESVAICSLQVLPSWSPEKDAARKTSSRAGGFHHCVIW